MWLGVSSKRQRRVPHIGSFELWVHIPIWSVKSQVIISRAKDQGEVIQLSLRGCRLRNQDTAAKDSPTSCREIASRAHDL